PLAVLRLGQRQAEQERPDRLRDMELLGEARDEEQEREHNDNENLVRRDLQQLVQDRRPLLRDDEEQEHVAHGDAHGQQHAADRRGAAEEQAGHDGQEYRQEQVVEQNHAQNQFRLG